MSIEARAANFASHPWSAGPEADTEAVAACFVGRAAGARGVERVDDCGSDAGIFVCVGPRARMKAPRYRAQIPVRLSACRCCSINFPRTVANDPATATLLESRTRVAPEMDCNSCRAIRRLLALRLNTSATESIRG